MPVGEEVLMNYCTLTLNVDAWKQTISHGGRDAGLFAWGLPSVEGATHCRRTGHQHHVLRAVVVPWPKRIRA